MKRLFILALLALILLPFGSCDNYNTPQGFEWANRSKDDEICTYIKYKQPVNNYTVSAICWTDTLYGEYNSHGVIHFQNGEQDFTDSKGRKRAISKYRLICKLIGLTKLTQYKKIDDEFLYDNGEKVKGYITSLKKAKIKSSNKFYEQYY